MKAEFAHTAEQLEKILELRFKILREPWFQAKSTSSDGHEDTSQNAFIEDTDGNVLACGRLQLNDPNTGQIRYMAVATDQQEKGLGKIILMALEEKAKQLGAKRIELQARENASDFYKRNGYALKEKTHLLFGVIQHYLMGKDL
jgi:N-acetylglutamate synthase-like GNAT family acetyltransferase